MQTETLHWTDRAARVGFLAKGVVYAIVGGYALKFALGEGGGLLDKEQVAREVKMQPLGQVLLGALGVGLACYALWRFIQAAVDPRAEERGPKRIAKRIGWAGSGLIHAVLALTAFQALTGADDQRKSWLAKVMATPGGKWLIIAAGAVVIAVGAYQIWRAYKASFQKKLETFEMSAKERRWAVRIGRFGLLARGAVFPIIGWFFIQAGLHTNAREAKGTGAALREIAAQKWGDVLLPIVAAGLIAYALFMGLNAKYRRPFA